ncbi:MAG: nitroreductase family protein [Cytophagales bacterium]|nr:nitroreductase family protein [Armatimonadota bacterium]
MRKPAETELEIHELLKQRWSPLAFAETPVTPATLRRLFEAARWTPSSYNEQPWRFIVGTKEGDPETYGKIRDTLVPSNQSWAQTAPVLILGVARTTFSHNDAPNSAALYDLGQAVANLTLQASELDLLIHQMGGYDRDGARAAFEIPDTYALAAVLALGYEGDPSRLADEKLQARHSEPVRPRRPLPEIVLSGDGGAFGTPSPLLGPP